MPLPRLPSAEMRMPCFGGPELYLATPGMYVRILIRKKRKEDLPEVFVVQP